MHTEQWTYSHIPESLEVEGDISEQGGMYAVEKVYSAGYRSSFYSRNM